MGSEEEREQLPDDLGPGEDWEPIRTEGLRVPPNSEILTITLRVCVTAAPVGAFGPVIVIDNCEIYRFEQFCYTQIERYWVRPGSKILISRLAENGESYSLYYEVCRGTPPRLRARKLIIDGPRFPPEPPPVPPGEEGTWIWEPPPELPFVGSASGWQLPPPDPIWFTDVSYVMKPEPPIVYDGCWVRVRWQVYQRRVRSRENELGPAHPRVYHPGDPTDHPTGTVISHDYEIEDCGRRRAATAHGVRPLQVARAALASPEVTGVLAIKRDGVMRYVPVKYAEVEDAIGLRAASTTSAIPPIDGEATLLVMTSAAALGGALPRSEESRHAGDLFVEVRGRIGRLGHPQVSPHDAMAQELQYKKNAPPDVVFIPLAASATQWEDT